jgi:hypothetical protein
MKKLLILTVFGSLLSVATGCRFMDCLWRGGPANQTCPPATAVTYGGPCATPCQTSSACDPCGGSSAAVPPAMPGPANYGR